MAKMLRLLLLLGFCLCFSHTGSGLGVLISQFPRTAPQRPGETIEITCVQNETSYTYMYWYKQLQGEGPRLIAQSVHESSATYEKGYNASKFPITRLNTRISSMSVVDLRTQDSANYFCAAIYFGTGTKLTVLEVGLNITSPRVAIFPPSKQEIKEKGKATLVCLATKFYPDHIKLFWEVNDAEREDGVRTDEFSTWDETSKSYSLTSRLRISTQEWFNSKNSFRCAVKFHLDEIQYEVIRGGDGE
uniref:Ig-like domain-containing protein n=1 Tax=Terrapene triunguis TaxID=2587831 RepID=A0A674IKY7_9SAUR